MSLWSELLFSWSFGLEVVIYCLKLSLFIKVQLDNQNIKFQLKLKNMYIVWIGLCPFALFLFSSNIIKADFVSNYYSLFERTLRMMNMKKQRKSFSIGMQKQPLPCKVVQLLKREKKWMVKITWLNWVGLLFVWTVKNPIL